MRQTDAVPFAVRVVEKPSNELGYLVLGFCECTGLLGINGGVGHDLHLFYHGMENFRVVESLSLAGGLDTRRELGYRKRPSLASTLGISF